MQAECPKASQPLQWLSYTGEQCTTILRIVPDQLQIKTSATRVSILSRVTKSFLSPYHILKCFSTMFAVNKPTRGGCSGSASLHNALIQIGNHTVFAPP